MAFLVLLLVLFSALQVLAAYNYDPVQRRIVVEYMLSEQGQRETEEYLQRVRYELALFRRETRGTYEHHDLVDRMAWTNEQGTSERLAFESLSETHVFKDWLYPQGRDAVILNSRGFLSDTSLLMAGSRGYVDCLRITRALAVDWMRGIRDGSIGFDTAGLATVLPKGQHRCSGKEN